MAVWVPLDANVLGKPVILVHCLSPDSGIMHLLQKTGIEELDTMWQPPRYENPADRPTANEVFQKLGDFISGVPPKMLRRGYTCDPIVSEVAIN